MEDASVYQGKKIVVVMPAYNAARTPRRTYEEWMEQGIADRVIVVDDASRDETAAVARSLPFPHNFIGSRHDAPVGE